MFNFFFVVLELSLVRGMLNYKVLQTKQSFSRPLMAVRKKTKVLPDPNKKIKFENSMWLGKREAVQFLFV